MPSSDIVGCGGPRSHVSKRGFEVPNLEFGISKQRFDTPEIDRPEFGIADHVGTPPYMAPEQAQGFRVSGACDVYQIGQIPWEMLVGQPAFVERTARQARCSPWHRVVGSSRCGCLKWYGNVVDGPVFTVRYDRREPVPRHSAEGHVRSGPGWNLVGIPRVLLLLGKSVAKRVGPLERTV